MFGRNKKIDLTAEKKGLINWVNGVIILIILSIYPDLSSGQSTEKKHPIPIGWDAYLMWDKLPQQRTGVRAYMRSTYDREGGNQSADASHFLFANEEDHNVTLDVKGKGILYFFRANHWHGSPWHFIVDGKDNLVRETGTSDPIHAKNKLQNTAFIPKDPFPEPLAWTWSTTKGADLIWTPMSFTDSFRIAYSRTRYGTGYYIYHLYANEEGLTQKIESWDINEPAKQEVVELLGRAGTDIAPDDIYKVHGKVQLDKPSKEIAVIKSPSSTIRALKFSLPLDKSLDLERMRLKVTWDEADFPSIDAPLCLFFGAGTFYNRDEKEYLVKGFPINIRFDYKNQQVELACYYPMPFFRSAKIEITDIVPDDTEIAYEIRYEKSAVPDSISSYLHATYMDMPDPELGEDLVFLDTKGVEGHDEWSGSFVGTSFIFSHDNFLGTLEGDPRFFFDDSQTPQAYGTGTEEWGGGGDYWGGRNMTLPLAGHPCGAPDRQEAKNERDMIQSAYRFLIADLMPFGRRAVIRFEHGGENLSSEHYETVTYWYGLPMATLIKTDEIDIGNTDSEHAHQYYAPDASEVDTIRSRYEWGIDFFPERTWGMNPDKIQGYDKKRGKDIYPEQIKYGRYTRKGSEFNIQLAPNNKGALLRRTLDYGFPNQTAEIYIGPAGKKPEDIGEEEWEKVGIWYLAGSNTCLYSDPGGELEKRLHRTKTSNRRFRDDEFLIPARYTKDKSELRLRVRYIPDGQELFPGFPFPRENAWSELSYEVYSYISPD
ncbi:DUF2961 domain-containing protein [Negadavirga shengliensis]|uniref:DUF2961 domain-containing protein n=1 Tax=Negadavirga shengliensis TaxID=1389218 RepID=A0ABV9T230_9BACT